MFELISSICWPAFFAAAGGPLLFGDFWTGRWWYAVPLIVSISLVYGATRHEHIIPILANAYKSALWIVIFMAVIFLVIWIIGLGL